MGLSVALLRLTSDSRRPQYIKFNTPTSPFRWAAPEDLTTVVCGSRTPIFPNIAVTVPIYLAYH